MGVPRIIYRNLLHIAGAVMVPSSEETGLARQALLRPHISDVLRFKRSWDIRTGENDRLDFEEQDPDPPNNWEPRAALLSAANYASAAAAAAEVTTKMNAAAGAFNTYSVTRDGGTGKYSIARTAGAANFRLPFATGPNLARSVHPDIGFASADVSGLTTYEASAAAYQSRRTVNVDVGSAQALAVGITLGHNVTPAGTIRLDAHASTMVGVGLGAAVDFSQALPGTDLRLLYFASLSKRYLRLMIQDVQNSLGYIDVGMWFAGPYLDLPGFQVDVTDARAGLSRVIYALGGAHHQLRRGTRKVWRLVAHKIDAAKKAELDAFNDYARAGGAFFFTFDSDDPASTRYVFMESEIVFESVESDPVTWNVALELLEVMG